jgi:ribonuclease HII
MSKGTVQLTDSCMKKPKYIIGIDEAGRGPLAGPVAVGVVLMPVDFKWSHVPGVGDSKALSAKKREKVYSEAKALAAKERIIPHVVFKTAKEIDKRGIAVVIREALSEGLAGVLLEAKIKPKDCLVLLDGGLKAPAEFIYQETIIKGDAKEKSIGLASIFAKVTRDAYMTKLAKKPKYAPYDFATHKGYGTKAHRTAIMENGLSREHRVSFCRNLPR